MRGLGQGQCSPKEGGEGNYAVCGKRENQRRQKAQETRKREKRKRPRTPMKCKLEKKKKRKGKKETVYASV